MQVKKRNGSFEPVNLDKVVNSIRRVCEDLGSDVDIYKVATKTVGGLVDGVSTREIDLLSIRNAVGLIGEDPSYSKVAGRILANVISKEVGNQDIQSFSQSIEIGYREGLINSTTHDLVMTNKRKLNDRIRHERDWLFEFHGIQTLYDRYLLKHPTAVVEGSKQRVVIETPQYFLMRVACGLANDAQEAVELYDLLSSLEYMTSTPTLFNSGTKHSQMSSCYLLDSPLDSLDDIYKRYGDIAMLSKFAGGIGVSASRIRGKGALIKGTNGKSNGIVPWLHTLSGSVAAVNQGGKRKGAAAVYLEPHHPDIMDFLELRDNTGEKERRAYNLNLANWVPDIFMKRVKNDEMWSLIDPAVAPELTDLYGDAYEARYLQLEAEGRVTEQLPARKVYARMMRTLAETGNGWMCFKDTSNKRGNQVGDDRIIHLSNLCVAPETLLLTREGHVPIVDLKDREVEVWNGKEWSKTTVRQTGVDQKLITVVLDNGMKVDTTPYHKFYKVDERGRTIEVRASELEGGERLIKHDLPLIEGGSETFENAYTHGFFCGDGTYTSTDSKLPWVSVAPTKRMVVSSLAVVGGSNIPTANERLNYRLTPALAPKFAVPSAAHSITDRLEWFAGLADADGTVTDFNGCQSIQIGSVIPGFLRDVVLMLQTLGVHSRIQKMRDAGIVRIRASEKEYPTKPLYRLLIASSGVNRLIDLGIKCRRLALKSGSPNRDARKFVRVVEVLDTGRRDDTYCVSEPKRHMAVFNGILTGNCTEILEVTSAGKRTTIGRNHMQVLTADEMIRDSVRIIGFNTENDSFDALTGAEIAVCLAEGTPVLTSTGYRPIEECDGADVFVPYEADNKFVAKPRFAKAILRDNGRRMTYRLDLSGETTLFPTADHKWLVRTHPKGHPEKSSYEWKMTSDLVPGDQIVRALNSNIHGVTSHIPEMAAVGWMIGDGWLTPSGVAGVCCAPEEHHAVNQLIPVLYEWHQTSETAGGPTNFPQFRQDQNGVWSWMTERSGMVDMLRQRFGMTPALGPQKSVPMAILNGTASEKASFLGGLFSADGCIQTDKNGFSVQLTSASRVMLEQVRRLLAEFGVHARLTWHHVTSRGRWQGSLRAGSPDAIRAFADRIGFPLSASKQMRLDDATEILSGKPSRQRQVDTVKALRPDAERRVFDLTVADGHHYVADGYVTHNCNLGSINIGRGYVKGGKLDKTKLRRNVAVAVKYLDRVIDRNYYPVSEAHSSNMRWRPVGLGIMGLADFFMQMRIPFDSEEAIKLTAEIQEEIYYQALKTSCELAQKLGPHRDFALTRAAKGDLQFDLAGVTPKDAARWDSLKAEIVQNGLRNSLLIAIAPTATISHICGVEECIEPIKSNLLKRETLSGEFIAINRYLVDDLKAAGMWNEETRRILVRDEGSVANVPNVSAEMKALYKTVWEMSMKALIAHAAARGAFIDQSQSVNFFIDLNKYPEDRRTGVLSSLYMSAWESGLKTTYYFRSRAASRIEKTTIAPMGAAPSPQVPQMAPETSEVCESCT